MKKILKLILMTLTVIPVYAQDYNYTNYTRKDGLAGETAYGIMQDHDGFIWFGTEAGLSRFDGRKFKNFTTADGLPASEVFCPYEDFHNRIWLYSFSSEIPYYKNGRIYTRQNSPLLRNLSFNGKIQGVAISTRKEIIIWDDEFKAWVVDSNDKLTTHDLRKFKMHYTLLSEKSALGASMLWLPPEIQTKITEIFGTRYLFAAEAIRYENGIILFRSKYSRMQNIIWFFREGKLMPITKFDFFCLYLKGTDIYAARENGGLVVYDYLQRKEKLNVLPNSIINAVFQDREKNIWFSTKGHGIYKLSKTRVIDYKLDENYTFPIEFIVNNNDNIMVGANNHRCWKITPTKNSGNGMPLYRKKEVAIDFKWVFQNKPDQLINITDKKLTSNIYGSAVKAIYFLKDGFLKSTSHGVYLHSNDVIHYDTVYFDRATTAIKDKDHYYVGTLDGLIIFNKNYRPVSKILPYRISYIASDKKNAIWVATYDNGVFKIEDGRLVDSVNQTNSAITSDRCRCVFVNNEFLWIGTDRGLNKVRLYGSTAKIDAIYTDDNGLNSDVINAVLVRDSIVYVGTSKGLNIFREDTTPAGPLLNLKITEISVSDRFVDLNQRLVLPHRNNKIKFTFSAISFTLEHIVYQYRVLGIDAVWQNVSEQSLTFLSLPSGNYILQIRAISPLGYKSSLIEKRFEVEKTIFEKWWFWAFWSAIAATILFFSFRYRINAIKKMEKEKSDITRKIIELEQLALRAQMNPHFIFNCLNSVQNYILKQDAIGANFYLSQFAGLVRETLENSSKLYISLKEEVRYLRHYIELEKLQANQPFDFSIHIGSNIDPVKTMVPNMILQPLVENAIKHGLSKNATNGLLKIQFIKQPDDVLLCTVEDNGPGIEERNNVDRNLLHSSKGLSITRKRIETLNQISEQPGYITINVTDLRHIGGQGTKIEVSVLLKKTDR